MRVLKIEGSLAAPQTQNDFLIDVGVWLEARSLMHWG